LLKGESESFDLSVGLHAEAESRDGRRQRHLHPETAGLVRAEAAKGIFIAELAAVEQDPHIDFISSYSF
jgi:hypothetical protein